MGKLTLPYTDTELLVRLNNVNEQDILEFFLPNNLMTTTDSYYFKTIDNYIITIIQ